MSTTRPLTVSIGIFAYNEEKNIGKTIESVQKQKLEHVKIKEIIVISSGSHDRTNQLIRGYAKKDKRIKFIEQLRREGKSSAINIFINESHANILIAISGDLRLHTNAIEEISLPFLHKEIGMVGSHPIPVNIQNNPIGQQIRLLWHLHHLISLHKPKCGEMVAFRKVVHSIPKESAVDEATLEVMLQVIGYRTAYAPNAIVYNKGPDSISDFLTQRRRVYVGHHWVAQKYHYEVSTMNTVSTAKTIRNYLLSHPQEIPNMIKLLIFEALGRFLGWCDYHLLNKNPYIWEMVKR